VAGYAADELEWPKFSRRWASEILTDFPAIPLLHMVDIRSSGWRSKHFVCYEQAERKVDSAIEIIAQSKYIHSYCSSLRESDYNSAKQITESLGVRIRREDAYPDFICFLGYAQSVLMDLHGKVPGLERVNFRLAEKKEVARNFEKELRVHLLQFLEDRFPELAPLLGEINSYLPKDNMPLQAADVLAWHINRLYAQTASELDKKRVLAIADDLCGWQFSPDQLNETIGMASIKALREKKHGTDADNYANAMARMTGFSKTEIIEAMMKEDKTLKLRDKNK
jgi:hypothetical protein